MEQFSRRATKAPSLGIPQRRNIPDKADQNKSFGQNSRSSFKTKSAGQAIRRYTCACIRGVRVCCVAPRTQTRTPLMNTGTKCIVISTYTLDEKSQSAPVPRPPNRHNSPIPVGRPLCKHVLELRRWLRFCVLITHRLQNIRNVLKGAQAAPPGYLQQHFT